RFRVPGCRPRLHDHIGVLDLLVGGGAATAAEHRGEPRHAGGVAGAVARVHVVGADDHAGELLAHVVHLVRRAGARQHGEAVGAVLGDVAPGTLGGAVERLLPGRPAQHAVLAHQWMGQAVIAHDPSILYTGYGMPP